MHGKDRQTDWCIDVGTAGEENTDLAHFTGTCITLEQKNMLTVHGEGLTDCTNTTETNTFMRGLQLYKYKQILKGSLCRSLATGGNLFLTCF